MKGKTERERVENLQVTQLFKIYFPDNGGGIATVMETVATFFDARNQEIVVCHGKVGKKTEDETYGGIRVHRCCQFGFAPSPLSPSFVREAVERMRESDMVIYHYPYPLADVAILLEGFLKRKRVNKRQKFVVWWHCDVGQTVRPFYHPLVRCTLKRADLVIVSAKNNLEMAPLLKKYRDKCKVIPFCVSNECLERGKKDIGQCEAAGTRKRKTVRILFMGRLVWYKGVDVLLRAYAEMEWSDRKLVILGDGPLRGKLEKLAGKLGLRDVHFTGSVTEEEKWEELERCDFLVLPSVSEAEAFGLVQAEAMAFGKPVVNTALRSGVPEVCVNGTSGITVPPGDVRALARAMDCLASDAVLREEYGNAAREIAEKKYTRMRMKEEFLHAVGELCSKKMMQ